MNNLAQARAKKQARDAKLYTARTLDEALSTIKELEAAQTAFKALQRAKSTVVIRPREGTNTSEAVAVACATDWHIGSRIRPEQVSGLNTFDTAIAKDRAKRFFERVVRLTAKERQDVSIKELVLFLGGDFIDGMLHLDTIQSNEIAEPISQAVVAQELIEAGLNFLLNHGKFDRITVVCCDGN